MSSTTIRPTRPKLTGECEALGMAMDDMWASQSPKWCQGFEKWFNASDTLVESKEAWIKRFRLETLRPTYGDPDQKNRTKRYRQAMSRQLPKRPASATPTIPFDLNTSTPHRSDGWFLGANIPGDWLEALCKIGRGHMPVQIGLALQHEAKMTGCPVDIELKSGEGSGNSRIREQFGVSGSGYGGAAHVLRSAGLVHFPDTSKGKRQGKRFVFTILGPHIGFDDKGWVHYLDGLPVRKFYDTDVEEVVDSDKGSADADPAADKDMPVARIRYVHRVGTQELTTHPLVDTRAKQILLDGEPYYPPYHKLLTTGDYLTEDEIEAIGRRLSQ